MKTRIFLYNKFSKVAAKSKSKCCWVLTLSELVKFDAFGNMVGGGLTGLIVDVLECWKCYGKLANQHPGLEKLWKNVILVKCRGIYFRARKNVNEVNICT